MINVSLRIALVQRPPAFLDLPASIEIAVSEIAGATAGGAGLIVFPETWLPGYPVWLDDAPDAARWAHPGADALYAHLFRNSASLDGPEVAALSKAAVAAGADVMMGMHERSGRTLYNTTLLLGGDGMRSARRKLIPTHGERLIWGMGDGSTLAPTPRPYGRLGSLICWEHWMPLARAAMHAQREDVHVAQWPAVGWRHLLTSRTYAFEGQCVVTAAGCVLTRDDVLRGYDGAGGDPVGRAVLEALPADRPLKDGGSCVIAPDATFLLEPVGDAPVVAVDVPAHMFARRPYLDTAGHYARPDVFQLRVDTQPRDGVVFAATEAEAATPIR